MDNSQIHEAFSAVRRAQEAVQNAQATSTSFQDAQVLMKRAEELVGAASIENQNLQGEDKHEFQRLTDLLRLVQETQAANSIR